MEPITLRQSARLEAAIEAAAGEAERIARHAQELRDVYARHADVNLLELSAEEVSAILEAFHHPASAVAHGQAFDGTRHTLQERFLAISGGVSGVYSLIHSARDAEARRLVAEEEERQRQAAMEAAERAEYERLEGLRRKYGPAPTGRKAVAA